MNLTTEIQNRAHDRDMIAAATEDFLIAGGKIEDLCGNDNAYRRQNLNWKAISRMTGLTDVECMRVFRAG